MSFPPIAVVGHGCVLPGAFAPRALWDTVVAGGTTMSSVPERHWGVAPELLLSTRQPDPDRVRSDIGGYVRDFDSVFEPRASGWSAVEAARFAPVFRWTVHAVAQALEPVPQARHSTRTGLVMGNLTYPTATLSAIALRHWRTGSAFPAGHARTGVPDPRNRFSFGQPAVLAGRLLGLGAGTLALDAACASSLYAVKLACDRLQDGEADVMVAGGAGGADSLGVHMGFTALGALSGRGRSLPLDRRADGLVPSEGAAFVTLMRLPDALAKDVPVLAVIRGIGWAANGRRGSILAPDQSAQERAMHQAYRQADLAPEKIGLLECHATGTPLGDAVEIRSSNRVFATARHLPAGSSKANFGHTLPAAGAVGLIKVVEALRKGVIPPAAWVENPSPELADGPLRLPAEPESWTGPRLAGVSAFGFGGSNAHMVVEGWPPNDRGGLPSPGPRTSVAEGPNEALAAAATAHVTAAPPDRGAWRGTATAPCTGSARAGDTLGGTRPDGITAETHAEVTDAAADVTNAPTCCPANGSVHGDSAAAGTGDVVIVGLGVRLGGGVDVTDFARDLAAGRSTATRADRVHLVLDGLPFPPTDFSDAHPQQALLLAACQEAVAGLRLPPDRTQILVGAEATPDTARYRARWQQMPCAAGPGRAATSLGAAEPLTANAVMRHMGAVLASQIGFALDLTAPAFAMSARESSGLAALRLATRAIRAGESDAAIVAAVATPDEDVHKAVLSAFDQPLKPVNAAVVLVAKAASAARRDGDRVLAVLPAPGCEDSDPVRLTVGDVPAAPPEEGTSVNIADLLGHADCAHGMVAVAVAVVALSRALLPRCGEPAVPWLGRRNADVVIQPADSTTPDRLRLHAPAEVPRAHLTEPAPRLHVYSGADAEAALEHARSYCEGGRGPARLVVQACGEAQLRDRVEASVRWLRGIGRRPDGVHYRARAIEGEVAFLYTGGAAAYHGMGRALLTACPDVPHALAERCGPLDRLVQWLYEPHADASPPTAMQLIWASSLLSRLHTALSHDTLGLRPHSVLGYSSGAASALISLGHWWELRPLVSDAMQDPLFNGLLTGACDAVRAVWRRAGIPGTRWATHLVGAAPERVRAALRDEPAVHLTAVNSPTCCTIGGEADACARVLERIDVAYAFQLAYDVVAHAPEVAEVAERWEAFHRRDTKPSPRVRFYDCATGRWQYPTAEGIAQALTVQAVRTVDFAATVEQAYGDGVRIFVEHGPKQLLTTWTSEILRGREHLAVALDGASDHSVRHVFDVAARLLAAGVPLDHEALTRRFAPPPSHLARAARTITVAADFPPTGPEAGRTPVAATSGPVPTGTRGADSRTAVHAPAREKPADTPSSPMPATSGQPRVTSAATGGARTALEGTVHAGGAGRSVSTAQPSASPPASRAPAGRPARPPQPCPQPPADEASVSETPVRKPTRGTARPRRTSQAPRCIPATTADAASAPDAPDGPGSQATRMPDSPRHTAPEIRYGTPARTVPPPSPRTGLPGPRFDRSQLERLAHGRVSELLGPLFGAQDRRRRQTRLPRPPMLLVDRVTGIDAEPASLGTGVIWTETDITADAWYLDATGRMAAAMTVEAGQAALLLSSWLGVGLRQAEDRVYRLLGCDFTFHGPLPVPGDTLRHRVEVTGHVQNAGVHLFFFQFDCWVGDELRVSVRDGQAGFFTEQELHSSAGVLWTPDDLAPGREAVQRGSGAVRSTRRERNPDAPPDCGTRAFDSGQVIAFAQGRPADCFGAGWELTRSHLRTPRSAQGPYQLIRHVTEFSPAGGPAGTGYLRAELPLTGGEWFFDGHFHNDPCMPETLMLDGGYQAMAFHLAALGLTIDRDAWRFEPVLGESVRLRCRGQVVPGNELLVYELFVRGVDHGPEPVLRADLLCTVDGKESFHAQNLALKLVPDTPLEQWRTLARAESDAERAALPVPAAELRVRPPAEDVVTVDGTLLDRDSMLASAWGSPRHAMGPAFASLPDRARAPRLPGPPYLCVDRVTALHARIGRPERGSTVETDFDLTPDAWFWQDSGGTLPVAILMEAALQPCGWLAQFTGCAPRQGADLFFRNLDGTASLLHSVPAGTRVLHTRATLREVTTDGSMVLVFFDVECTADGTPALTCSTSFGYFPGGAFEARTGLSGPEAQEPADHEAAELPATDLTVRPEKYRTGPLRIGHPRLVTLDRITRCSPSGGAAGLGSVRGEQDVRADNWYFRAHFFQDPVQPGSLGVEGMYQLLRILLIEKDFAAGMRAPVFDLYGDAAPLTWKYRGQVTPTSQRVVIDLEITETGETQDGRYALAQAWLSADGLCIYHVRNIALRVAESAPPPLPDHFASHVVDTGTEPWLGDHRPTHAAPTLPMTCVADLVADVAYRHAGRAVRAVEDLALDRWIVLDKPRRLLTEVRATGDRTEVRLLLWRDATTAVLSRYEQVATAVVRHEVGPPPDVPAPLSEPRPALCLPYEDGGLFHGPAFRSLVGLRRGLRGSTGVVRPSRCRVPYGTLAPGLLDAALHVIPHQAFETWDARVSPGKAGYPRRVIHLRLYERLPTAGALRVDARLAHFADDDPDRPVTDVYLHRSGRVLATMRVEEKLLPLGFLGHHDPLRRQAFLRDRVPLPEPGIGRVDGGNTTVTARDVAAADWFPGTVRTVFGVPDGIPAADLVAELAVREHVARRCGIHPSQVLPSDGWLSARTRTRPLTIHHLSLQRTRDLVTVRDVTAPALDTGLITRWWQSHGGDWDRLAPLAGLVNGFLSEIELGDTVTCEPGDGTGRLYVSGPDVDPAALVHGVVNSVLRNVPTLLLGGGAWTRRLLRLLFDSTNSPLDLRACPCSDPGAPAPTRAAAHLAHGGDVVWTATAGATAGPGGVAEELLRAALRSGASVHPVSYRPMAGPQTSMVVDQEGGSSARHLCHHLVAAALPPGALAKDPVAVTAAAVRALDDMAVRSLTVPRPTPRIRPTTDGTATDDALLSALARCLPGVPARGCAPTDDGPVPEPSGGPAQSGSGTDGTECAPERVRPDAPGMRHPSAPTVPESPASTGGSRARRRT
ncbi:beta-ketoacyl synthase N-terminal-like domain-containing protein [Streptomyces longwoodensis]|uniref:beta-ketoacyl synthase N-terminal-like domain-containing protein n=1 Tax=Streptomyces longwoodensis TaxID=68231 RepID=UPI003405A40C